MYDVIVIGAGTSGMMASISAASAGAKVLLIEKNKRIGKKLLLTGGGRCNVTNAHPPEDVLAHIPGNGKFLFSAFSQFNNYQIIEFFSQNGVALKEEDHGRLFPVSNRSKTIVSCLQDKLIELKVTIKTEATVKRIETTHQRITGVTLDDGQHFQAPCVIVATGGKTYPQTGSTGDGYRFAKALGHSVTPLFPTESPLLSDDAVFTEKTLQGLALQDIALKVLNQKNKVVVEHEMDLLFTHFGLSGPAALRSSMFVNRELEKSKHVTVSLDCFPKLTKAELIKNLHTLQKECGNKSTKNSLKTMIPERLVDYLLKLCQFTEDIPFRQLTDKSLNNLVDSLKDMRFSIKGTWPIERSFVTGGGISLKEIQPKSLESKIIAGLFFTGEVLDINGYTGGYNITAAFVTGHVAGQHSAALAKSTFA